VAWNNDDLYRQKNLLCLDCKKAVCGKCGVECPGIGKEGLVWLCKICSESRQAKPNPGPTGVAETERLSVSDMSKHVNRQRYRNDTYHAVWVRVGLCADTP
jgi:hypothetical protein